MNKKRLGVVLLILFALFIHINLTQAEGFPDDGKEVIVTTVTVTSNITNISQAGDTNIDGSQTDDQTIAWDAATSKWIPQTVNGTGGNSSLNESYIVSNNLGDNSSWNQTYADTLYADISVTGGNSSWNQTHAESLFLEDSQEGDLNVNSSVYWNNSAGMNQTQFSISGLLTSIKESWLISLITNAIQTYTYASATIDSLILGNSTADRQYTDTNIGGNSTADRQYTDTNINGNLSSSDTFGGNYSTNINTSTLEGYGYYNSSDFSIGDYATHGNVQGNSTADRQYTDTNIGGNSTADRQYTDTNILANLSSGDTFGGNYSTNVNNSVLDGYGYYNSTKINTTQMQENGAGELEIKESWLTGLINGLIQAYTYASSTIDSLILGNSTADRQYTDTNIGGNSTADRQYTDTNINGNLSSSDTFGGNYSTNINTSTLEGYGYYNSSDFSIGDYATHGNVQGNSSPYQGYYNSSLINTTVLEDQGGSLGIVQSFFETLIQTLTSYLNTNIEANSTADRQYTDTNLNANISSRVSDSGDTMTGDLNFTASWARFQFGYGLAWGNSSHPFHGNLSENETNAWWY